MPARRNSHLKGVARTLERHVAPRRSLRVKGVDPPWYPEPQFRYPTHTFWTSVTPPGTPPHTPPRRPAKPSKSSRRWKKDVLDHMQHRWPLNSVEITHVTSEVQESKVRGSSFVEVTHTKSEVCSPRTSAEVKSEVQESEVQESEVQESEVQSPRTSPRSNSGYERTWRITSSDSEPETEEEEWCARRDAFLRQAI